MNIGRPIRIFENVPARQPLEPEPRPEPAAPAPTPEPREAPAR